MSTFVPIANANAVTNALVWLFSNASPPMRPSSAEYDAQIVVANATHRTNHHRRCRVIPHDYVNTVRPPGMNRAVISSSPPRSTICKCAQASFRANFGLRSARRRNQSLALSPIM